MASRGGDRGYKVVYSSRVRETDEVDDQITRQRSNRNDNYYDDSRSSRDDRTEVDRSSRASDSRSELQANGSKTTYKVGRNRNSEAYVKRSNASNGSTTERPSDRGRSEYEILRPQKRDDGVYVVDLNASQDYGDRDTNGFGAPRGARYYDIESRSRRNEDIVYDTARSGRDDRSTRNLTYKDVQVTEEDDEETNYGRRGRGSEAYSDAAPSKRHRSSMRGRNNSPPEFHQRRREQSVGFYRNQISNHDASESRHEKPGAEAHIAGRYLVDHRGEYVEVDDDYRSRPRGRYASQRMSGSRINGEEEYDDDKRTYTEDTVRKYEYEDNQRRNPYPPQRSRSRRRQRRHDDDDRRSYSEHEYETRVVREEYY
ncbi:hypothetical protein PV11_07978 [Exophiala sideris]|uniref:Uncharacterized protein n=1 Tax=Exophiala sideris TaxID=1016849 RepID=A0A0D1VW65_9EURO|nr:hypothetical protein PV11_07978 [Exophiala sideris]